MEFYYLLERVNFDFNKATEIFNNMTDLQRIWLGLVTSHIKRRMDSEERMRMTRHKVFGKRSYRPRRI